MHTIIKLMEFLADISMPKICLIFVIIASSILAVPVDVTTELPVDPNVDPCNDFYEFTCAKFKRNHPVPEDTPTISQTTIMNDLVHTKMKTLLEKPIDAGEIRPFQLAKSMYQACMDTKKIEANSLVALKKIMKTIGDGWPVTEGKNRIADTFDWQKTAYQFFKNGFENGHNIFFQVDVNSDPGNSTKLIINLSQPIGLVVPDNLMKKGWKEPVVKAYYEFMKKVAKKFGADQLTVNEEMKDVINLEIALSKIKIPKEEKRNHSSITNLMTIRELQKKYPYVDWLDYISYVKHPGKKGHPDEVVNVNEPKYLKKLKSIIKAQTQRNIANYMYWQAIVSVSDYMDDEMLDWKLEVKTLLNGMGKRQPRWQECIEAIYSRFQVAYGALYIRNFFNTETKTIVADMIHNIKNELEESIKKLDWMDDATKERALQKSRAMQEYTAYPDELLDDAEVENYYEDLNTDAENYLESMLNVTAMTTKLDL